MFKTSIETYVSRCKQTAGSKKVHFFIWQAYGLGELYSIDEKQ